MKSQNRIKNQTALVTGASSGIGHSCALYLASYGLNLVLTGRRPDRLEELKYKISQINSELKVSTLVFDIQNYDEVSKHFSNLLENTKIDILINNAGLALGLDKISEGSIDDWEKMIDTNIKGLLYVSKWVIPYFKKQNSGHIVNIGSVAGVSTYPMGNVYCATKSAVHVLSEAMNLDLVDTDIRVSNIAPGACETEFSNIRFKGDSEKADKVYKGYTPLTPDDVADLILYILNTPKHINIQNSLIMPTAQRNPYVIKK